jgi:hypothetical protein
VEGSATFEKEEEPTRSISVRWARNLGAPATRENLVSPLEEKNFGRWWCTWIDWNLIGELLRTSTLKKGALWQIWPLLDNGSANTFLKLRCQ